MDLKCIINFLMKLNTLDSLGATYSTQAKVHLRVFLLKTNVSGEYSLRK